MQLAKKCGLDCMHKLCLTAFLERTGTFPNLENRLLWQYTYMTDNRLLLQSRYRIYSPIEFCYTLAIQAVFLKPGQFLIDAAHAGCPSIPKWKMAILMDARDVQSMEDLWIALRAMTLISPGNSLDAKSQYFLFHSSLLWLFFIHKDKEGGRKFAGGDFF